MQIGIFARTFNCPTLAETLDAVVGHGIGVVQLNLSCAGLPNLPDQIDAAQIAWIRREMEARALTVAAISGTFNMIDPDLGKRRDGLRRLRVLASACKPLGTSVIGLCTGTRDPDNMWRRHPENDSPEAWRDLLASMAEAVTFAEEYGVTLVVEPEVSNVVDSARKARRLLDEMRSPHVKIVIDGANLYHTGELPRMRAILAEAFELLGEDIVMAHAKDLSRDGEAGHEAAGQGVLDYDCYLSLLHTAGVAGPLILHSLTEDQVDGCIAFLREKLARIRG
ncbi:MAG: sugar phosphate isomerase/epimerase [Chloroflexi bacterium]|nr:sugar phosphate isomerase/epimerase [Chloroflexota bacterium]